jgi:carbon monoxide dehydrogenase subunit G
MQFKGEETIPCSKQKVWEFITKPDSLIKCLPEVQSIEKISEEEFKAKVRVGIGFIKSTFDSVFKFIEKKPVEYLKIEGKAKGAGSYVDLLLEVNLSEIKENYTKMNWRVDVSISGPLASLGSRNIKDVAARFTSQLISCIIQNIK